MVLAIPELFEAVLLQLPAKDLLLAQRVSKAWQEMINTSIQIQRALFFKPRLSKTLAIGEKPELNPWLEKLLTLMGDRPIRLGIERQVDCARGIKYDDDSLVEDSENSGQMLGPYHLRPCEHDFHLHYGVCTTAPDRFAEIPPTGSWRKMLAANPPCPLHIIELCSNGHHSEKAAVTIGEIVD